MTQRLLLPCLRGAIGTWVTYTCLMRLSDIKDLISFADDLHKNKNLSQLIQRQLKRERKKEIGDYLLNDEEAFFNSLVVAVYEGEPRWHQFDKIGNNTLGIEDFETPDYTLESMGYLSLSREEKIFALDGQHRLAGIQYALEKDEDIGRQQISVIFLAHFNDAAGLKRTRRLFTTLNKRAKPVNKDAIISLDEDDLCACVTRYLVEESSFFGGDRLKYQATNNVGYADTKNLTTIGNLYDLIKVVIKEGCGLSPREIDNYRGGEEEKGKFFNLVESIFSYMFSTIPCLAEFDNAESHASREQVIALYRNRENGGHFLYRPAGLKIYLQAMCKFAKLNKFMDFESACFRFIEKTQDVDLWLESDFLRDKVWDATQKTIMVIKAEVRKSIIMSLATFAIKK
ncbi:DGQHR domain-containing protein [Pseudomonas sp. NFACC13-1]|uniref:DGQHR domain-containing protein n=1 Tax=Pseudomonas sp. NFACC13-1 TaxID=1566245 RepID=UPI00088F2D31|nr:DGQHR domain-containing protein [Pseudomonas sp. NFACC13-1]SDB35999.1 DNA sulfur modification protein DndB [Pseudomonas sp. NFACC13-1]